ncbi:MAG: hypothetical protein RBR43_09980 [Desulfuromonadaceae bacterium]|nr:hypothetical protein [Desulfuromonadaceae bacterium]
MNEATETENSRCPRRSAGGAWLAPVRGLTYRKGTREANIHAVLDGTVYYGMYEDGSDVPVATYRANLREWKRLAKKAMKHGASVFMYLGANARHKPRGEATSA